MPIYSPIYVNPVSQQQGYGTISTLITPFFTDTQFPVTNSLGAFNFFGTGQVSITSSAVLVSDYNNHTFQANVVGSSTGSFTVYSTVDGRDWITEFTVGGLTPTTSSVTRITGRRLAFISTYSANSAGTASLYLISGQ